MGSKEKERDKENEKRGKRENKEKETSYLFFLDIDGTMIGDITPQICEWVILKNLGLKSKMAQYRKNLIAQLHSGLLRPGLADFLDFLKSKYGHIELFVYTAADPVWAATIVPCIEEVTGIRFNRPLFTRTHCEGQKMLKSLNRVMPVAAKACSLSSSSSREKGKDKKKKEKMKRIENNVVLIDNSPVLKENEMNKWIVCPTYGYVDHYDVLRSLNEETLKSVYGNLIPILINHGLFPSSSASASAIASSIDYITFKGLYFERLAGLLHHSMSTQEKTHSKKEKGYWHQLAQVMNQNDSNLKDNTIKKINHDLAKFRHRNSELGVL